jgi:hypothetical protein
MRREVKEKTMKKLFLFMIMPCILFAQGIYNPSPAVTVNVQGTGYSVSGIATGTTYALTNSSAEITFGTTSPSITLAQAGTYLILGRVRFDLWGESNAAKDSAIFNYYRTNNTPGVITNSTTSYSWPVLTTQTYSVEAMDLPFIVYTTTNTTDILQVYGNVAQNPGAGQVRVMEAQILAIRLY